MKRIDLVKVQHDTKIGQECPYIEPNITDDCIFYEDGVAIGFYIKQMPDKMCKLANLASKELMSDNVKKEGRLGGGSKSVLASKDRPVGEGASVILGSVPPKPYIGRPFKSISSQHNNKKTTLFIKAMLLLAKESELLIKEILPNQYEAQKKLFEQVHDKWKFGSLWTSSVSNLNLSAPFHRDTGNIVGAVNVIITKRLNAKGGNLHVPDYNATMDSANNSILVYPAWKNIHGVTPIIPTHEGGYRNSLIFYPLKAFVNLK